MFKMAYAIGTTTSENEDIMSKLKAETSLDGVANAQHPFAVLSLQLETTKSTGVSINGSGYIPLRTTVIDDTTTVYRYEVPLSDQPYIKELKIEDTDVSWSVVFQHT